jgi:hypothetical protein
VSCPTADLTAGNRRYAGHHSGVVNYWVYFNDSPIPDPADLVIFDDARLAERLPPAVC